MEIISHPLGNVRILSQNDDRPLIAVADIERLLQSKLKKKLNVQNRKSSDVLDNMDRLQENTYFISLETALDLINNSTSENKEVLSNWLKNEVFPAVESGDAYKRSKVLKLILNIINDIINTFNQNNDDDLKIKSINITLKSSKMHTITLHNASELTINYSHLKTSTEIAREYDMSAKDLHQDLKKSGLLKKDGDFWELTDENKGKGYVYTKSGFEINRGRILHWTPAGQEEIYNRLKNKGILPIFSGKKRRKRYEKKSNRITFQKYLWCRIRFFQQLHTISDENLALSLKVHPRTLHQYDRDASHITLEKIDSFLENNSITLNDLMNT